MLIVEHFHFVCLSDLGSERIGVEVFGLSVHSQQSLAQIEIRLSDLTVEDKLNPNKFVEKVMLHVGQRRISSGLLDDLSVIVDRTDYAPFIEESLHRDDELDDPDKSSQSSLNASLFHLKSKLVDFFNSKKPIGTTNSPKLPRSSVVVKIDNNSHSTEVDIERVLVLWNSVWISTVIQLIDDLKKAYSTKLSEVFKKETPDKSDFKTSNEHNRQPITPVRKSRFSKVEKERVAATEDKPKQDDPHTKSPEKRSSYSIRLQLIQFFNFNKSFFQTEILVENLNILLQCVNSNKSIELTGKSLTVNDLTGYPFTKPLFELVDPRTIKRQMVLSVRVPSDVKKGSRFSHPDEHIPGLLAENSFCMVCELKSPEEALKEPGRVKNKASIHIRSATINYYQQLIFRLIDLINMSIYPTVLPDVIPKDPLQIWRRMSDFFRTQYVITLYQSKIVLKPNRFLDHWIQLKLDETLVSNKTQKDQNRDLSKQNRPFFTETISVEIKGVLWEGHSSPKESVLFHSLDIDFTRFLFQTEVKLYYGREAFFSTVRFGNDVLVSSESLHLNLDRNDFILLMTTLYGNINFDDLRSNDYLLTEVDEKDKYSNPMSLTVQFKQLFVYFRYDLAHESPRVFCVFSLPFFKVKMEKFIDSTKDIKITSQCVKSWAFEVSEDSKAEINCVHFIQPILSDSGTSFDDFGISLLMNQKMKSSKDSFRKGASKREHDDFFEEVIKNHQQQKTFLGNFNSSQNNDSYFSNLNGPSPNKKNGEFSMEDCLFRMNVKTDAKGSDTRISVENHKIVFIKTVFFKLMEFTQMVQEMGVNSMMQPLIESNPSNIKFQLSLTSTLVTIPFDSQRFPQPLTIYMGHGSTTYNRSFKPHSTELGSKLSFFQSISRSFDLGYSDHSLSMFENALNFERLSLFQIDYELDLRQVHIFVPQRDDPLLFVRVFRDKRCCPDFPKSVFESVHSESDNLFRFIAYEMSVVHSTESLFSNSFRSLMVTKGNLKTANFVFALTTSDIVYLSDFGSFLSVFGFEKLNFENSIQSEIVDILSRNTNINSNEYSYSRSSIPLSQRKHTSVERIDVQVILLDDVFDTLTPLVRTRLVVDPTLMLKTNVFEDFFRTELTVDIGTFNCPLRVWEPVVEHFRLSFSKSSSELLGKQSTIVTTLNRAACINASVESVSLLLSLHKNFVNLKTDSQSEFLDESLLRNYISFPQRESISASKGKQSSHDKSLSEKPHLLRSVDPSRNRPLPEKAGFSSDHLIQSPFRIQNSSGRIIEVVLSSHESPFFRCVIFDQEISRIPNVKTSKESIAMDVYIAELCEDFSEEELRDHYSQNQRVYTVNGHQIQCGGEVQVDDYFSDIFVKNGSSVQSKGLEESAHAFRKKRLKKTLLCSLNDPLKYFTHFPRELNGHHLFKIIRNSRVDFRISSSCAVTNKSRLDLLVKCNRDHKSFNRRLESQNTINLPVEFENSLIEFAEIVQMSENEDVPKIEKMSTFSHKIDIQKEFVEFMNSEENLMERECILKVGNKHLVLRAKLDNFVLDLSIDVPLVIENASFRKLKITDPDGTGFEATVSKNETDFPVYFRVGEHVNLTFKMADLQSEKVSFKKKDFLKDSFLSKFWLIDESGNSTVKVSVHISKGDRIKMVFFYEAILVNETFANWWFSQTLKGKQIRSQTLVPQVRNSPQILFVRHKKQLLFGCENHQGSTMRVDFSHSGPSFHSIETLEQKSFDFSVYTESRKVTESANVTQEIVHLVPKYIFINQTKHFVVLIKEPQSSEIKLSPNSRSPIVFSTSHTQDHSMSLKIGSHRVSQRVNYSKTAFYRFSVESETAESLCLVNMEVNFSNNSFYSILVESEIGCCHITNKLSSLSLLLYQDPSKGEKHDLMVHSGSSKWYSWKDPLGQTERLHFDICESATQNRVGKFAVDVRLKETRQTIQIKDQSITLQTHERGYSLIVEVMHSQQLFEGRPVKSSKLSSETVVNVESMGVSLIYGDKNTRKELAFVHFDNLLLRSENSEKSTEMEVTLDYFSVDFNAKKSAVFPVLLVPKFQKSVMSTRNQKCLKMKVVKKNDCFGLNVFENIELEVFPCVLKIEEECLVCALRLQNQLNEMTRTQSDFFEKKYPKIEEKRSLLKFLKKNWRVVFIEDTQSFFIQRVSLSEIEIILSFRKSLETRTSNKGLTTYLNIQNALGVFLTTIDDFPLTLPDIQLSRDSKSVGVLKEMLMEKYKTVAFNSVLKLIASSNLIGNPMNLYNEFKSAFKELIRTENRRTNDWSGNTQSFVKHVLAGTSGSVTKMSRTMSDGLSALTIDNEYLLERERLYARSENKFLIGLRQMGFGVVDGLRGLVLKPVEGATREGFKGVVRGTYQGLSGLFIKPLTGFLDLTSATADGIRQMCLNRQLMSSDSRQRPPRAFYSKKRFFKKYDWNDAEYHLTDWGNDDFQLILVEDVNCNLEKIIVFYEGIFILDHEEIIWRKPIDCVVGVICKDGLMTIEVFDVQNSQIIVSPKLLVVQNEASGNRITSAINSAVDLFNKQSVEDEESVIED